MEPTLYDVLIENLGNEDLGAVVRFVNTHEWGQEIEETDERLRTVMILAKKYSDLMDSIYGEE